MFTGLIEDVGTMRDIQRSSQDWRLVILCGLDLAQVREGDSIAVNGACLTVVARAGDAFTVEASAETVARTTFQELTTGARVNLERSLALSERLHGHLVQGHVDAVGRVVERNVRGRSVEIWFRVPEATGRYIVAKGSVAIDGVSLTVNAVRDTGDETRFAVNIIPHTRMKTTLDGLSVGTKVNVESDLIGRYVERLLAANKVSPSGGDRQMASGCIDTAWLKARGIV
ncbi:MAG: riboflavin synthase [Magnetococcales bacterium]|nr:riboflavin synthase [Magnetococcales bacterium]MBF0322077.1 riboflavin synthase [Magnetococcales bacterium]